MPHTFARRSQAAACCHCVSALQDDLQHIRAAYEAFLVQYPLCYGYWKKYAEAERRHSSSDADAAGSAGSSSSPAVAVYQRAVAAVPHSTELWVAYASLLQASDTSIDAVRR